jgi:AcrR family transcriptional regulator
MRSSGAKAVAEAKRKRLDGPRVPARGRGKARFATLLDATEALLDKSDPDAVGLYQIAEKAGIPPASVYHFFPTKEAAYEALAERLVRQVLNLHKAPIAARRLQNWQDLFRIDIDRARDFYNSHPPAAKIFYGGYVGVDAKKIDKIAADQISSTNYDRLNRVFHMPFLKDPRRFFEVRLGILDAIWTISVRRHGHITDDLHEEAFRACIAYSGLYLPTTIERREYLVTAAERDQSIVLPFETQPEIDH